MSLRNIKDFPALTYDKLRYADTDRQGHINNATFATFFETGRVEMLLEADLKLIDHQISFVIVSIKIDFIKEITWPGKVEVATGIARLGNSSITLYQQLYQNDVCVATCDSVIVQLDTASQTALPLDEDAKQALGRYLMSQEL